MKVEGMDEMSQEEYRFAAVEEVKKSSSDVEIPKDLKETVREEELVFLAKSAYNDACRPGNSADLNEEIIINLYKKMI